MHLPQQMQPRMGMEMPMSRMPQMSEGPGMRQMRGHGQAHPDQYGPQGGMGAPPRMQQRQMNPPPQYDCEQLYDDHCLPYPQMPQLPQQQMQAPLQQPVVGQRGRKGSGGKGKQRMTSQEEDQSIAETLVP